MVVIFDGKNKQYIGTEKQLKWFVLLQSSVVRIRYL